MSAAMHLGAAILGFVVLFRGILSLLPGALAREYDGSLSPAGFWLPFMGALFVSCFVFNATINRKKID